jgi:hypothetical protein
MKTENINTEDDASTPQGQATEQNESIGNVKESAMTPLERVRAGQAKMRGQRAAARGSQNSGAAPFGGSRQRTSYPRKSG